MSEVHLVEAFLEMMSAERGAAKNTIEAYRRDLSDYLGFLAARQAAPTSASRENVVAYLASLDAQGLSASSSARRLSAAAVPPLSLRRQYPRRRPDRIVASPARGRCPRCCRWPRSTGC